MVDVGNVDEPPVKRQKLLPIQANIQHDRNILTQVPPKLDGWAGRSATEQTKEAEVGITTYVRANMRSGAGLLKKRYTDFLVNEILPTGEVLHLRETSLAEENEVTG